MSPIFHPMRTVNITTDSKEMNISARHLRRILSGESECGYKKAIKIAKYYGTTVEKLDEFINGVHKTEEA